MDGMAILSGNANPQLAQEISAELGVPLSDVLVGAI